MGRAGWLSQKVFHWKLVEHDVANECPVRGPDGRCREVAKGQVGELLGKIRDNNALSQFRGCVR